VGGGNTEGVATTAVVMVLMDGPQAPATVRHSSLMSTAAEDTLWGGFGDVRCLPSSRVVGESEREGYSIASVYTLVPPASAVSSARACIY